MSDTVTRGEMVQAVNRAMQSADARALIRYGHLEQENGRLLDALRLVSGTCARAPGSCSADKSLRRDAFYLTGRWCPQCIARDALQGQATLGQAVEVQPKDAPLVARGLRVASHSTPLFTVKECAAMRSIANRLDPDGAM